MKKGGHCTHRRPCLIATLAVSTPPAPECSDGQSRTHSYTLTWGQTVATVNATLAPLAMATGGTHCPPCRTKWWLGASVQRLPKMSVSPLIRTMNSESGLNIGISREKRIIGTSPNSYSSLRKTV